MDKIIKEEVGYSYHGKKYRSKEEIYFSWFLEDVSNKTDYALYEPFFLEVIPKKTVKFINKTQTPMKDCHFLQRLKYTPDFVVKWNRDIMLDGKGLKYLWRNCDIGKFSEKKNLYYNEDYLSYIEIKGSYSKRNTDLFPVKQKIIYDKLNIYVQKIVPKEFFKAINYYPERYLLTDGGQKKRKL